VKILGAGALRRLAAAPHGKAKFGSPPHPAKRGEYGGSNCALPVRPENQETTASMALMPQAGQRTVKMATLPGSLLEKSDQQD